MSEARLRINTENVVHETIEGEVIVREPEAAATAPGTPGPTSGASVPEVLVQDVLALLAGLWTLPDDETWPVRADRLAGFVLDGLTTRG